VHIPVGIFAEARFIEVEVNFATPSVTLNHFLLMHYKQSTDTLFTGLQQYKLFDPVKINKKSPSNLGRGRVAGMLHWNTCRCHIFPVGYTASPDFPRKFALILGDLDFHQIWYGSLGPPDPALKKTSRSSQPFFHSTHLLPTDKPTDQRQRTRLYYAVHVRGTRSITYSPICIHPVFIYTVSLSQARQDQLNYYWIFIYHLLWFF